MEEVDIAKFLPLEFSHREHLTELSRREWQEWLKRNAQISSDLESEMQDSSGTIHVGLSYLPRLGIREILVTYAGEVHSLFLCITEAEITQEFLHLILYILELSNGGLVVLVEGACSRNLTIEVLLGEHQSTIDEVAIDSHKFVVVAGLEVCPGEVVVFGLRRIGSQHIAEHILLIREIHEVLVEPYRPVARGRDLVALEVEELVGRYIIRHDIAAFCLEHRWEDDTMEDDVVLANEMNEAGRRVLPPSLPRAELLGFSVTKLFGIGDIADRRIKPHIEHFAFSTLHRYRDTPIKVAGHSAWAQTTVEP